MLAVKKLIDKKRIIGVTRKGLLPISLDLLQRSLEIAGIQPHCQPPRPVLDSPFCADVLDDRRRNDRIQRSLVNIIENTDDGFPGQAIIRREFDCFSHRIIPAKDSGSRFIYHHGIRVIRCYLPCESPSPNHLDLKRIEEAIIHEKVVHPDHLIPGISFRVSPDVEQIHFTRNHGRKTGAFDSADMQQTLFERFQSDSHFIILDRNRQQILLVKTDVFVLHVIVLIQNDYRADHQNDRESKLEDNHNGTKPGTPGTLLNISSQNRNGFESGQKKRGIAAGNKPDKQQDRGQNSIHIRRLKSIHRDIFACKGGKIRQKKTRQKDTEDQG